jgi:hypothetical protein
LKNTQYWLPGDNLCWFFCYSIVMSVEKVKIN